ncbi:MAG: DNA internalization-related competence protein ComEC/Rec2 [Eubacteriales bacterium]
MVRRKGALFFGAWIVALSMMASLQGKEIIMKLCFIISFLILFSAIFVMRNMKAFEQYQIGGNTIVIVICIFLAGSVNFVVKSEYEGNLLEYEGENVTVSGIVTHIQKDDEKNHQFILKMDKEKVLVKNIDDDIEYKMLVGRYVSFSGKVSRPASARNPGTFDYARYLRAKGVFAILTRNSKIDFFNSKKDSKFLQICERVKLNFEVNIYNYFDKQIAGIVTAMAFGEKGGLDEDLYAQFQKNGICHILAVSGLHIGAVYAALNAMMRRSKRIAMNLLIIVFLFFYVALAGFAPSVVRAFIMIFLHIMSMIFRKRYDMFTASLFTMFIMTVGNPMLVTDLGFQLSFCAILTLGILIPSVTRITRNILVSSCAMQIGMAPISAYVFNYFSISAFLLNIPIIFIGGITVSTIIAMLVISSLSLIFNAYILSILFQILGIICEFFVKLILFLNEATFYGIKPYIQVTSPPIELIFVYYSMLFFVSSEFFRIFLQRKKIKNIAIFTIVICLIAFLCGKMQDSEFDKAQLIFCDVGQGDCLLVRSKDGKNILLDTGGSIRIDVGEKIVLPFLLKNGVKHLDLVLISHFDKDHVGGLSSLEKHIKIDKVAIYEGNCVVPKLVEEKTGVDKRKYLYLAAGDELRFSKNLKINIFFPARENPDYYKATRPNIKDENLISLVAKVTINNVSVMMTGDLDFNTEEKLVQNNRKADLKCDILKVSHHGSRYGSSKKLLDAVMPKIAVIQVGKNNYGHPSDEAIERLKKAGALIYRNDQNGAVGIMIYKNKKIGVKTMF